jgi:hypothetical protein
MKGSFWEQIERQPADIIVLRVLLQFHNSGYRGAPRVFASCLVELKVSTGLPRRQPPFRDGGSGEPTVLEDWSEWASIALQAPLP